MKAFDGHIVMQQHTMNAQRGRSLPCRGRMSRQSCVTVRALAKKQVVLVGDIGGTNARLSAWRTSEDHKNEEIFAKVLHLHEGTAASLPTHMQQAPGNELPCTHTCIAASGCALPSPLLCHMCQTYPTNKFATFDEVVAAFLKEEKVAPHPPQAAALAVAGAVVDNRCAMTNTSWILDGPGLQQHYGIK